MPGNRLKYLFNQYLAKSCTDEEKQELAFIVLSSKQDDAVKELMEEAWTNTEIEDQIGEEKANYIVDSILTSSGTPIVKGRGATFRHLWSRIAAAASVLLLLSIGGYFIFKNKTSKEIVGTETQEKQFKNDIAAPSNSKATITLANGKTVPLDSLNSGTLATQGSVSITKTVDGQIIYNGSPLTNPDSQIAYNTLTNPRGSTVIDITLADGSQVWLNAGSSITYPVVFVGKDRKVQIDGEAYFEVAHNKSIPFKVSKDEMEVSVLGTHFNVNAYDDEAEIKVTLLEGSVKVASPESSAIIKPGQQAVLTQSSRITTHSPDLDAVMAWKNGVFKFKEANIESIMRQVEKWYDVEVTYEGKINSHFVATIPRTLSAGNVFKILEETGSVHFKIEGSKVIVKP